MLPRNDATPDELAYVEETWQKVSTLPGVVSLSRSELDSLRAHVFNELDDLILIARKAGVSPRALESRRIDAENVEIAYERNVLLNGFSMQRANFRRLLGPILAQFDCVPDWEDSTLDGESVEDVLFDASSSLLDVSREAEDQLIGVCDNRAVSELVKTLRRNYETLVRCQMVGKNEVRAVGSAKVCEACGALDGKTLAVSELLAKYTQASVSFPHQLASDDGVTVCLGPILIPT